MKNKKVLFITDASYPNLTMNGVVIKNIIDYIETNNTVGIISLRQRYNDTTVYRNIKIRYVKPVSYSIYALREKRFNASNRLLKSVYGFITLLIRIFSVLQRIFSKAGLYDSLISDLKQVMVECIETEAYDYVVLICRPFEAFSAALPLAKKYEKVKFIGYQVDNFVTGEDKNYPKFLIKRRNKERAEIMNQCSKYFWRYFISESVYLKEKSYFQNRDCVKTLGLPLILNQRIGALHELSERDICDGINLVYAGSLLKGFRPPEDCLDILMQLAQILEVHIDFYQRGNCDDILNSYAKRSGGAVVNHGTVSSDKAYEAVNSADVLIAISNFAGDQISGKTFDCISTGKPVIFFYYRDDDLNIDFFNRYQLGLCVRMSPYSVRSNAECVCRFIKENWKRTVSFDNVEKKFWKYTPKFVADEMFG